MKQSKKQRKTLHNGTSLAELGRARDATMSGHELARALGLSLNEVEQLASVAALPFFVLTSAPTIVVWEDSLPAWRHARDIWRAAAQRRELHPRSALRHGH
jgi:hypothetical protein